MKKNTLISCLASLLLNFVFMASIIAQACAEPNVTGITYTSVASGNWSSTATWQGGVVPNLNIGSNNKVVIRHNVSRNTSNYFFPASNSVLVIEEGGALTTAEIQMEQPARFIINYGRLTVSGGGNFQVKNSSASICASQACITVAQNFQLENPGNMTFNYSGITVGENFSSYANMSGSDNRVWVQNGNLERKGGSWPGSFFSYRRVSGNVDGISGIPGNSSQSVIQAQISPCTQPNTLPVHFLNISAEKNATHILVEWSTTFERNDDHFDVETSADGQNFKKIGEVKSAAVNGDSDDILEYKFSLPIGKMIFNGGFALLVLGIIGAGFRRKILGSAIVVVAGAVIMVGCTKDDTAAIGHETDIYIRLAQVDKDGSKQYSKIIKVVHK